MFIRHLTQALTPELTQKLRDFAQAQNFEAAPVNYYGEMRRLDSVRNNDRFEWDSSELAVKLEQCLVHALGDEFPHHLDKMPYTATGDHFRIYRYRPGQYFKPHRDGSFRDAGRESLVTVLFYLNDSDGGETVLMPYGPREQWAYQAIAPKAGDVLLFEHRVWHEGRPVHSGEKYVLRTDLFYTNK